MSHNAPSQYQTLLRRYRRQRRVLTAAAVVIVVLLLRIFLGKTPVTLPENDFARYHNRTFPCVNVVDGDTIDVGIPDPKARRYQAHTRIRLWGIDTPEMPRNGRAAMHYARQAGEFARTMMAGKSVRLELIEGRTRGHYGRLLAYVYLPDGQLYNRRAVATGHAYAEARWPHPLLDEFLALEAKARTDRLGLWKELTPDQLPKRYPRDRLKNFWKKRPATRPAR